MNRQIRIVASLLTGLFPLLLAAAPASAGTSLPTVIVPLPGAVPPPPPNVVQYPFAKVKASEFSTASHMGRDRRAAFRRDHDGDVQDTFRSVLQYHVRFTLDPNSDGLAPPGEQMLLSAAPDPNAPQAATLPVFQVSIPSGCFVDMSHHMRRFDVDGLGCGVEVRLHDPVTTMDTSLNDYVHHFRVKLIMRRNGMQGNLQVRMNFTGFNAPASANPSGVLNLNLGNDGVTQLPMVAPDHGHGHRHGQWHGPTQGRI